MSDSVLVVDDERSVREFAVRLLEQQGFECRAASSAAEALARVAEERPHIVLTDVSLPGGPSGIALVGALTPLQPDVACVVLTGSADQGVASRALAAGAFGFVRKPCDADELLVAVQTALQRRASAVDERRQREDLEAALTQSRFEAVERLARAVESRDQGTGDHIDRMSALAGAVARELGWTDADAECLRVACVLHDVGKVGIPDEILLKPGQLTRGERSRIEQHCETGRAILAGSTSELLRLAETIAWTHHERVDGGGYPRRLVGDDIPLAGRIAAVADVYDALTSDRPYRAALERGEALAVLRADAGLDPRVVRALVRVVGD